MSTPLAYWTGVGIGVAVCLVVTVGCRRWPGPWVTWAGRAIAVTLALDAVIFLGSPLVEGGCSVRSSLPLSWCDIALVVAAIACWMPRWSLAVELSYFAGANRAGPL